MLYSFKSISKAHSYELGCYKKKKNPLVWFFQADNVFPACIKQEAFTMRKTDSMWSHQDKTTRERERVTGYCGRKKVGGLEGVFGEEWVFLFAGCLSNQQGVAFAEECHMLQRRLDQRHTPQGQRDTLFVDTPPVRGLHTFLAHWHECFCAHMHTKSSDRWTNKPVLPKDRIRPPGGGSRHFLPSSSSPAVLLSCCSRAFVCRCGGQRWVSSYTQALSVPMGSEGRGWAIKGQEGKQMRRAVWNKAFHPCAIQRWVRGGFLLNSKQRHLDFVVKLCSRWHARQV